METTTTTTVNQTPERLNKELAEAVHHLHELRFACAASQLKQVREIRLVRQQIARLHLAISKTRSSTS